MNMSPTAGRGGNGGGLYERLRGRGVVLPAPESLELDETLDPQRIAPGVVIHAGCRLHGPDTSIGPGCRLGEEAPVTLDNCRLGHGVSLAGGCFREAVLLDGVAMGSGAHVRPGTLLEEEVSAGQAVGFKQTVLFPYVSVGSLVNFCDALLAGGEGPDRHSEIGSAFVHFNYTPRGDKATASLIGDVPRGVMLDQAPIFLGGQAGLVGPARIAFGCVLPAGVICRGDMIEPERIYVPTPRESWGAKPYDLRIYRRVRRRIANNLHFMGNLRALREWYRSARSLSMDADPWRRACREGAESLFELSLAERVKQLDRLSERLVVSVELLERQPVRATASRLLEQQRAWIAQWPSLREKVLADVAEEIGEAQREVFLKAWGAAAAGDDHLSAVKALDGEARRAGTAWLSAVAREGAADWLEQCPR